MNYRNRKLLDLPHKGTDCKFLIAGVCIGYQPDGCVPAHSNEQAHGKGMRIKADDHRHVQSCNACHDEYDGRTNKLKLSRLQKKDLFAKGWERTIDYYFTQELVGVK